jgi:succinate-acetate transporter protein
MKKDIRRKILEKLGFSLSLLCALHCLATPFLLAFLPAFGELFPEELELPIILASFGIATMVIGRDMHTHKHFLPLILVVSSFLVLIVSNLFTNQHIFDVVGIVGILAAYLLNWHKLRKAKVCACA